MLSESAVIRVYRQHSCPKATGASQSNDEAGDPSAQDVPLVPFN